MLLDGKKASEYYYQELKKNVSNLDTVPSLSIIQIGDSPASNIYIRIKKVKLSELGFTVNHIKFPESINTQTLQYHIHKLNADPSVNGIIVQLPVPEHLDKSAILNSIVPKKDVDCLTDTNIGKIFDSKDTLIPATPLGIVKLLSFYSIPVKSKKVCIVGRSALVGKPLSITLLNMHATVTVCHSHTTKLVEITKSSDIVVTAIGKAEFFDESYFTSSQTVIDVGTNKNKGNKLVGDVNYSKVKDLVTNITPVPGGVGPMTVFGLAHNLINITTSVDQPLSSW